MEMYLHEFFYLTKLYVHWNGFIHSLTDFTVKLFDVKKKKKKKKNSVDQHAI